MLDFIRSYYSQILTALAIVVIIVLVVVSLFKGYRNDKNESIDEDISKLKLSNKAIIIKNSIQDYSLVILDKNGNQVFKSKYFSSVISIKHYYSVIIDSINEGYSIEQISDEYYKLIFFDNKHEIIGYSNELKENEIIDYYIDLKEITLSLNIFQKVMNKNDIIEINNTLIPVSDSYSIWKTEKDIEGNRYSLINNDQTLLTTYIYPNNKNNNIKNEYKKAINNLNFIIIKEDNIYRVGLRDNNKSLIFESQKFETIEDCYILISKIVKIKK